MREVYGENSQYREYIKNKTDDLMTRMGNAILSEMREYSKHDILFQMSRRWKTAQRPEKNARFLDGMRLTAAIKGLRRSLDATLRQKRENQSEYEQMIYNIEH